MADIKGLQNLYSSVRFRPAPPILQHFLTKNLIPSDPAAKREICRHGSPSGPICRWCLAGLQALRIGKRTLRARRAQRRAEAQAARVERRIDRMAMQLI